MFLARIVGNATSVVAHPSVRGQTLFICQPIGKEGGDEGEPFVAVGAKLGAGIGSRVIVSTDGIHARDLAHDPHSPIRNSVIGVVDD